MNLLDKVEESKLHIFLKTLKQQDWIIDKRDFVSVFKLIDWYELIYGEIELKDERNMEKQLNRITKDLCDYFKVISGDYKKCMYCKEVLDIDKFVKFIKPKHNKKGKKPIRKMVFKGCDDCRHHKKCGILKRAVLEEELRICNRCKKSSITKWLTCTSCREYNKAKQLRYKIRNNI